MSITAQSKPIVFARDDFPAGVNVRDYVELGAFELNRSGQRRLYLSLIVWSTLNRSAEQQAQTEAAFAALTLWADDRPIQLQRAAAGHDAVGVSTAVFTPPSPNAYETYYAITAAQLNAMTAAKSLYLTPATQAEGEQPYKMWRDARDSLNAFVQEVL